MGAIQRFICIVHLSSYQLFLNWQKTGTSFFAVGEGYLQTKKTIGYFPSIQKNGCKYVTVGVKDVEPCQRFQMECLAKIVNGFQPLTTFAKRSILKVWRGSECASEDCLQIQFWRRSEGSRFNNSSGKVEQNQQLNNTCYRIRNRCSEWKFTYKLNVDFFFQLVSQSVCRPAKQSVSQSVSQSASQSMDNLRKRWFSIRFLICGKLWRS